jgi:SHS2 domain-containing protein
MTVAKDFEILEHTADIGIIAYGADLKQAFANAAKGLSSLITDPGGVEERLHRDIELSAADEESLLVDWLNELVFYFDAEGVIFRRFEISRLNNRHLKARGYGEKVDSARHDLKRGVKAATYHMLKVERDKGYRIQVLFDI